ncbi:MAG: hypothetical protein P8163_21485 [Candidatus Thiodiazotropha sp.]
MPKDSSNFAETSLRMDLLNIYDELTEIHDYRPFLRDAFASLVTEDNCLDKNTAMGASRFSYLIKQRMQELKGDLKKLRKRRMHRSR